MYNVGYIWGLKLEQSKIQGVRKGRYVMQKKTSW